MLKKAIVIGISVLSLLFVGNVFAADMGQATMVLKGGHMGDIQFPHKLHQEKVGNCDACHKLFPKEAGAIEKGMAAGTLKKKEVMKNCEECHKANKKEGKPAGPTSCKGCHKK